MNWKSACSSFLKKHAPRTLMALDIARHNRHFEPEYWLLPRLCQGNASSVDVGGNTGHYAYYLSRLTRQVHVFEPNPICLAQLRRVQRRNMVFHEVALSDHAGTATNHDCGTYVPALQVRIGKSIRINPLEDPAGVVDEHPVQLRVGDARLSQSRDDVVE